MKHFIEKLLNVISPITLLVGRTLLGLIFLWPGIMKFFHWEGHIAMMEKHHMVMIPVLLATAAVVQIVLGSAVILNRFVPVSALILAGLVIIINFNLHDFWNFPGEMQNFVKNMAIIGGLLVLSAFSWKTRPQQ